MVDDRGDNELRDAFGAQITAALNLRSGDDVPAMSPVAARRRTRQRVLAGALTAALLAAP